MAGYRRTGSRRARPIRSARPGTGSAPISRCSRRTPQRIDLCLFDPSGRREIARLHAARMHRRGLARLSAGRAGRPALRLSRPRAVRAAARPSLQSAQAAARSLRARARRRAALVRRAVRLSACNSPRADLSFDRRDSAPGMLKARGDRRQLQLGGRSRRRNVPWSDTVIYEAHLRGLTMLREDIRPNERGTFAALARCRRSSITCAGSASPRSSCCRCTPSSQDRACCSKGLRNYWGYNTLGFFALEPRYLSDGFRRTRCASRCGGCTPPASR